MLKKNFLLYTTVVMLTSITLLNASQQEFTVPAAPPPQGAARPATVLTPQQVLAAGLAKVRAANADEDETQDASASEVSLLKGEVEKLTKLVHLFEKKISVLETELQQVRTEAEANRALDDNDKEGRALEKECLQNEIKMLLARAKKAEEEVEREKSRTEIQARAEQEKIRLAVARAIGDAQNQFATREAELIAELDRRTEELRIAREAEALAKDMLRELQRERAEDRERMQKTEKSLNELQKDRTTDEKLMQKLEDQIKKLEEKASQSHQPTAQTPIGVFEIMGHPRPQDRQNSGWVNSISGYIIRSAYCVIDTIISSLLIRQRARRTSLAQGE